MAKIQTRRSVSFNRDLYERIAAAADAYDISIAKYVERAVLAAFAGDAGERRLDDLIAKLESDPAVPPPVAAVPDAESPLHGATLDVLARRVGVLPRSDKEFDALLARSSVGQGLANIKKNGIGAEIEDLADEMGGVRVEYDDEP